MTGTGLHLGRETSLLLSTSDGPVAFVTKKGRATLAELTTVRTDRGVRIACPRIGLDVDGVEHFLAALGGLGIRSGVDVTVHGDELPLLDGAALAFCEALDALDRTPARSELAIVERAELRHGDSLYRFTPGPDVRLHVDVDFTAHRIPRESATWDGTAGAFLDDVAWARTFGFASEAEALMRRGRARGVSLESVLVMDDEGSSLADCMPPRPGEFARHKLLDLVGDLYLQGGPPLGTIAAERPGHTATRAVFAEARALGIVVSMAPQSGPSRGASL